MNSISKTYNPSKIETGWYETWYERNYFHAEPDSRRKQFSIMMPPPNVTGILHMGHALQSAIQDTLTRYYRMKGFSALWMPGTDHAGIATQNVVEKKLLEEGKSREQIGRDAFIEEVWKWKERHGGIIKEQQMKLGSSCDWERERFTMDEGLSHAVRTVFVRLFEEGLIYQGKYIVNWCPFHQTALSDEEVKHVDQTGSLWYIQYPLADGDGALTVATTRPETMLGDTAVAVNPDDDRYKNFIGRMVILPVQNRAIPVIADEFVDMKFGTGAVKVTPAHDPNDFTIGNRHNLPRAVVIDESGKMTAEAGSQFAGLDRFECRKKLVAELENEGYLVKIEDHQHSVGQCYRCSTIIEPLISEQWFLKMTPLAEKAMQSVRSGEVTFFPKKWEKDFFYWMENIRDWCISRQLWWGHRIPVWYCQECGEINVSVETPEGCKKCGSEKLQQEEDVLDTWFSSWLWPFSTLNWPEDTPEFRYFYPTTVLVSGYDILFFWIARMIMAGVWFTGKRPFNHVYITGIIKDERGRIMSKSLGNGIDPIDMVEKYGADAVRYSLVVLNTDGQDIKLSPQKFEMGRNFANKIWNAFRFLKLKEQEISDAHTDPAVVKPEDDLSDRWIISRLHSTWRDYSESFTSYKLNEAANALYAFLWHYFCDWYVELIKIRLNSRISVAPYALKNIALPVFKKTMELLHPIMPFITEEIWQSLGPNDTESISITDMGDYDEALINKQDESEMNLIQQVVYSIRNIRGEMNVPPAKKAPLYLKCSHKEDRDTIRKHLEYIYTLAKVEHAEIGSAIAKPAQSAVAVLSGMEIYIPLKGLIDVENEKKRLQKEITRLQIQLQAQKKKLSNKDFLKKAPPEIIQREREKSEIYAGNYAKLIQNLTALEDNNHEE